jgi:hypothetical protein
MALQLSHPGLSLKLERLGESVAMGHLENRGWREDREGSRSRKTTLKDFSKTFVC